jgi:hypothetical protein
VGSGVACAAILGRRAGVDRGWTVETATGGSQIRFELNGFINLIGVPLIAVNCPLQAC